MSGLIRKSLDAPDETQPLPDGSGKVQLLKLEGGAIERATFEPGWRWSTHLKSVAGTDSCQATHTGYVISGRMGIKMDDGQEDEFGPGDYIICPPGHDAWIEGDVPCVIIDWQGLAD